MKEKELKKVLKGIDKITTSAESIIDTPTITKEDVQKAFIKASEGFKPIEEQMEENLDAFSDEEKELLKAEIEYYKAYKKVSELKYKIREKNGYYDDEEE